MDYELVIGLEVHAQLKTQSKLFCPCSTAAAYDLASPPNTFICPICVGHPGVLPAPINREAVRLAIRMAAACGCAINDASRIDRKNYFYPDLPKGYQLSQFYEPIGRGGSVAIAIDGGLRSIQLTRIHMEEDAGRIRTEHFGAGRDRKPYWLIDMNRCGVPLIEIVTEPVMRSADEAVEFLRELRRMLRGLGVSAADFENGNLRCDVNISLRPRGDTAFGVKTEIKNLNSFQFIEEAIEAETRRQRDLLAAGKPVQQATVGYRPEKKATHVQRVKEGESGYRYFREPDQLTARIDARLRAEALADMPPLPARRLRRWLDDYGLADSEQEARALLEERALADHFEAVYAAGAPGGLSARAAFVWTNNDTRRLFNAGRDPFAVPSADVAALLIRLEGKAIVLNAAREIYGRAVEKGESLAAMLASGDVAAVGDDALRAIVNEVLTANAADVEAYRAGNEKVANRLVGEVMKRAKGKADGNTARALLLDMLKG